MTCMHCGKPLPAGGRRDRRYCDAKCRVRASTARREAGIPPPAPWRHPALESANPALQAAAVRAQQLGAAHGWNGSTTMLVLDGLVVLLDGRPAGERVTLTEIRARTSRWTSSPRVAEVLDGLGLLADDTTPAVRSWIDRRASELPAGFAEAVRCWLLVLLDGDARTRPRSQSTLYVYSAAVDPFIQRWAAAGRGHLREITDVDVDAALETLRGWPRHTAISALRSLFRFAKKRGLVFTDPTARLKAGGVDASLLPLTDAEIRAVQQVATSPAQRMVVALAAVHAARDAAIRRLLLDEVDLPNRRITLAGHTQRLGELPARALRAWLRHRRTTWPHTPNRHVLISNMTALGTRPVSKGYFQFHLRRHGVGLDRIRKDRILHEALTAGPDPLHLSLVFNLSLTTASRYAAIAQHLLDGQLEQPAER